MRVALRNRYYCDHCRKSTGTSSSMVKHEKACTMNPDRECGVCSCSGGVTSPFLERARVFLEGGKDGGWKALSDFVNECPACLLSTDRLCRDRQDLLPEDLRGLPAPYCPADWDFRAALEKWWKEMREIWRDEAYANSGGLY